ncbi:hypothetical protein SAY86_014928 [Trapa natans]|uniref:Thioredoxin domain-containing protein n=1 Tax=Trapa natans TaxID=22666 RepID=A0AAN7QH71_TRANT|nr:hypothetical protein SAY86_014928 [Trapa natans]
MAFSLKSRFCVSGLNEAAFSSKEKGIPGFCSSIGYSSFNGPNQKESPSLTADFMGKQVISSDQKDIFGDRSASSPASFSLPASCHVNQAMRWWENDLGPNMVEINSAQELISSLLLANDRLVVIYFHSPGCGGCRALNPKIFQLAELYPDAIFLKVNYEELGRMCRCLNISVLPFFQFYRGTKGRVCSFSCTNATIKKFKDALGKHVSERCIGPAKGLNYSELLKLASCGEIPVELAFANMSNISGTISPHNV